MTGFSRVIRGLALAAVLGVAGCGIQAIHFDHFDLAYEPGEVAWGAGDALYVEVIGAPTPALRADQRAWRQLVVDAVDRYGPKWFVTDFTDDRSRAHDLRYRLRLLFGVPINFNIDTACEARWAADAVKWQQTSDVMAIAMCREQRELSAARASVGALEDFDPESGSFAGFLGIAARTVMPISNPILSPDCFDPIDCP